MLAAIRSAHRIAFAAYTLQGQAVKKALEQAASRGASVRVRLEGFEGEGKLAAANARAAAELRTFGVDAHVVHATRADSPALHLKAAVCDDAAYLDDCNWRASGDTVLLDNRAADARAIATAALRRTPSKPCGVALDKRDALEQEVRLLRSSKLGADVDVATETISYQSAVYASLLHLARAGTHCRLLVNAGESKLDNERAALDHLVNAGVEVRATRCNEKLAVVSTKRAWIGSANATSVYCDGDQIEWGIRTRAPALVRALQSHFDAHWKRSRSLR